MFKGNRRVEENLLLFLSALAVVAVLPFVILRILQGDHLLALWNAVLASGMAVLFVYVYTTRKVKIPGVLTSLAFLLGSVITVHIKGVGQIYWAFPAFVGTFYMMNPRGALVLCIIALSLIIPILISAVDAITSIIATISLVINIAFAFIFAQMTKAQREKLTILSTTDPLTGVFNRRVMNDRMASIYHIFQRSNLPTTLLISDIDHFKTVNDTHGHYVGDEILIKLTKILSDNIRVSDSLFRYGGEEFVIIAENTDIQAGAVLAEKLRKVIESSIMHEELVITVSIGVAQLEVGESKQQWVSRADQSLLQAKREGRNRTCMAQTSHYLDAS
jgi:diguanylate cyclase (GGDEF)-like protein